MKRMTLMLLVSLTLMLTCEVDAVGQMIKEPAVWLIDDTENCVDLCEPFVQTVQNLHLGEKLRVHSSWDSVYTDRHRRIDAYDIWIRLSYSKDAHGDNGHVWLLSCGYMLSDNGLLRPVEDRSYYGFLCDGTIDRLRIRGYELGNHVVNYVNARIGR